MSNRIRTLLATAAVFTAAALSPVSADLLARGELTATCDGYTVTFYGDIFAPGESININWQVVRITGGNRYIDTGSTVLFYNDGGTANKPQKTITTTYASKQCGSILVARPDEDGGQGSKYSWTSNTNPNGNGADLLFIIVPPGDATDHNHFLNCSCTPVIEECRRADFWAQHAGTENGGECGRNRSGKNIVGNILTAVGGIQVCGKTISNTTVGSILSAEEALCLSKQSVTADQRLELVRQLTATALGCVMSGGTDKCFGISIRNKFADCDLACVSGDSAKYNSCIEQLSCYNNGGIKLSNGMCQIGTCNHDGVTACGSDHDCNLADEDDDDDEEDERDDGHSNRGGRCKRTENNCASNALVNSSLNLNFDPPGPNSSKKACKQAKQNSCTVFNCP